MQLVFEKNAPITRLGGSIYVRLEEPFYATLGVEKPNAEIQGMLEGHDAKIAVGLGKHGKFVFLYSSTEQKKWLKTEKAREEKEV